MKFLACVSVLAALVSACSPTQKVINRDSPSSSEVASKPSSSTAAPKTIEQLCAAQSWPRPVPQVAGLNFDEVWMSGSLACWPNVRGLAPDGHDATGDKDGSGPWKITTIEPPPGTLLARDATITAKLIPADITRSVVHPCEWVTVAEIEAITGISSVETSATDDYDGAVSPSCSYIGSGDALVDSDLMLPPTFAVDAPAQLEMMKTDGHPGAPVTGLPAIDAYCTTAERTTMLMAVLSGGRGYRIMASSGQTCEQLKKIAQAALGRVPN